MNDLARLCDAGMLVEQRTDLRFVAENQEPDVGMTNGRDFGTTDHRFRPMVTAHPVQGYRQSLRHPVTPSR